MSARGRSISPRPLHDVDVDMDRENHIDKPDAKVVIITNLTRNVVEPHLKTIFGFYGKIAKIDLPVFGQCEQMSIQITQLPYADAPSCSRPKSRESSIGVCRRYIRPYCGLAHGRRPARRRGLEGRTLRLASPFPLALPTPNAAPAQRP